MRYAMIGGFVVLGLVVIAIVLFLTMVLFTAFKFYPLARQREPEAKFWKLYGLMLISAVTRDGMNIDPKFLR